MSRRATAKPSGIQMFPFLAVLICTMGALVVLLHAFARHGQLQAIKVAQAKITTPQFDVQDFEWRMKYIREARDKTQAQLAEERLKLAHVEDHARRLRARLEELESAAAQLEQAGTSKDDQAQQRAAELESIKAEMEAARAALDEARQKGQTQRVNYAIVPYEGPNRTRRRPIYIECRAEEIVLQPEGIVLTARDFSGYFGPSNPLAAAVRAKCEYLARQAPDGLADEPYPLLLVRPDGVMTYNAARRALISWGSDFGYELIDDDWQLAYGEEDPMLTKLISKVVGEARVRHRQFTLTAPEVTRRSRPVYRATQHGGFVREGGETTPGGRSSPWDNSDWATGGGGSDFSGSGEPYGALASDSAGDSVGGTSTSPGPYDAADGGGPGFERGRGTPGDARGTGGSGRLLGEPSGGDGQALRDPYGDLAGPSGDSAKPYGDDRATFGKAGPGRGSVPSEGESGTSPWDESAQAEAAGERSERVEGKPGAGQHVPGGGSASGSPGGTAKQYASQDGEPCDSPSCDNAQQKPHMLSMPHHSQKRPPSIAATRGSNWGLPESAGRSVAATRPIRVLCYPDRLVLVPESRGERPREIPLQTQTSDSVDELVSAVWEHMRSWGKAGSKLYWRPLLSIDVQPGGMDRYHDIESLLADSGIDVQRREPRGGPGQATRPGLRRP